MRDAASGKKFVDVLVRVTGVDETLSRQLARRFGPLPEWAVQRLGSATAEQLDLWAEQLLDATSLEAVFAGH